MRIPILASSEAEPEDNAAPPRTQGSGPRVPERPETFAPEAYPDEAERLPEGLLHSRWRAAPGADHKPIHASNLVLANPQGHGISDGVWERGGRLRLSGFDIPVAAPMFPLPGEEDVEEARTRGLVLSASPFEDESERFSISATHLKGEAGKPSPFDTRPRKEGDATSLAIDSALLDGKLRLHGEYAYSRYNSDRSAHSRDLDVDEAQAFQASYAGDSVELGGATLDWSAGMRVQEVGEDFHSLGNSGLARDQRQQAVFSNLSWSSLSLHTELSRAEDNLEADPTRPQVQTEAMTTRLAWRPQDWTPRDGLLGLFNSPSFQVAITERERSAPESAPWAVDWSGRDISASAQFNPGRSSWSLRYHTSASEDRAGAPAEIESETVALNVRKPISDSLTFNPRLQYTTREDLANEVVSTTNQGGFRIDMNMGDEWQGSLNFTRSQNASSNELVDNTSTGVNARLEHQLLEPTPHRLGVRLHVDGGWEHRQDAINPDNDDSGFRIYTGVDVSFPGG